MDNYIDDVKKYDKNPSIKALDVIANNLRLVMTDSDARFVSTGDPAELKLVVDNFAKRKLNASEAEAEQAVNKVAAIMKDEHMKNRVTFYYLVAKELGKLDSIS